MFAPTRLEKAGTKPIWFCEDYCAVSVKVLVKKQFFNIYTCSCTAL